MHRGGDWPEPMSSDSSISRRNRRKKRQMKQETAALLLASLPTRRRMTQEEIAARAGVNRRTLYRWRRQPAFAAWVQALAKEEQARRQKQLEQALHRYVPGRSGRFLQQELEKFNRRAGWPFGPPPSG